MLIILMTNQFRKVLRALIYNVFLSPAINGDDF